MPDSDSKSVPSGPYARFCGAFAALMRKLPCLGIVSAVIAAELPLTLNPEMPPLAAALFVLPAVLLPLLFLPVRNVLFQFVLPAAAGFFSILWMTAHRPSEGIRDLMLADRMYAEAEVVMEDPALSPGCGGIPGNPKVIRARVLKLRQAGENGWTRVDSPAGVRWTGEKDAFTPGYGDVYRIRGVFEEPRSSVLPDGFDYAAYLARTGIGVIVRAKSAEKLEDGRGLRRMLFDLREKILLRIIGPMRSDEAKSLAAGILFGFAQGLDGGTKRDFIRTGTIHILTVSGTHVALFAALMFLLFAALPFRQRICAVIALTFCYAWMTGLREPSFRAFLMLALFLGAKLFLLRTRTLNSLALAASVLLIVNPGNLTSPGFQFSFLTVTALLLASPGTNGLFRTLTKDRMWVPAKFAAKGSHVLAVLQRNMFQAAAASVTAFAAGVGLTARYQGFLAGSAASVNMLLLPLVWLCFAFAAASAVFGWFFPRILEQLLLFIPYLCGIFADAGCLDFAVPPLWSVFAYLVVFFLLLIPAGTPFPAWKAVLFAVLCLIPCRWHFRTAFMDPEAAVFHGQANDNRIALVVTDPVRRSGTVVNLPDYETAQAAVGFLRSRGITRIRHFIPEDTRKSARKGLPHLPPGQEPLDIFRMPRERKNLSAKISSGGLTIERSGDTFHAVFSKRGKTVLTAELARLPDGAAHLVLTGPGGKVLADRCYPPMLNREYERIELKEAAVP